MAELAAPWPLKLVLDRVLGDRPRPFQLSNDDLVLLAAVACAFVAIAIAGAVASFFADYWLERAGERIVHDLRTATYQHLQRLSLAFHDRRPKGDLVTRVTADVSAVGDLFAQTLGTLASAVLVLAGMAVVTLLLDPVLALATFLVAPPLALVTAHYQKKIRLAARRQRAKEGEIASLANEALSAMHVVKAFGTERFEHERVERTSAERLAAGVYVSRTEALFGGLVDVLGAVSTAVVLVFGTLRVASGALTPGELVVFVTYTGKLYRPLRDLARTANRTSRAMARAERIGEILAADDVLEERPGATAGDRASGLVELQDVSFGYSSERTALRGVSLALAPGEQLALVGPSGAGKSTIGALVARFYDPASGCVRLDGRDARDWTLPWLRDQVGVLLQETILFSGSVAENIAYGTDAGHEEIVAAARAAGAHGFVSALPDGYETRLGPRGVGLSGGERQRIGIARVLLRNPPVLVLDEPTTGLDAHSEARVLEGLRRLVQQRTTLLITHSTALAASADRVAVLEGGRIVEAGEPDCLLAAGGAFARLTEAQRAATAGEDAAREGLLR
jgi:ATP-binding cassette subfamily B protein